MNRLLAGCSGFDLMSQIRGERGRLRGGKEREQSAAKLTTKPLIALSREK